MLSNAWRRGVQRSALLQARGSVASQLNAYLHASAPQHNVALEQVSQQGLDVPNLAPSPSLNDDVGTPPVRVRGAHLINRAPRRHGWKEFAPVSTLDASKLQPTDAQDLSGLRFHGINIIPDPHDSANHRRKRDIYRIPFTYTRWPLTAPSLVAPFPEGTRGFFYFYHNALHPATSGVRFRVVPSGRPEDFAAGHDLLTSEGVVWGPRMYRLVHPFKPGQPRGFKLSDEELRSEYYRRDRGTPIRKSSKLRYQSRQGELLDYLTDFHISEEDLQKAKMVCSHGPQNSYHSRQQFTIESLNEPFTLPLGLGRSVRMITPNGIHVLRLQTIWSIARMPVWDGLVRARLELSTLNEHVNTRTVVIRILDILDGPRLVWHGAAGGVDESQDVDEAAIEPEPTEVRKRVGVWANSFESSTSDRGWSDFDVIHLPRTSASQPKRMLDTLDESEASEAYIDHASGSRLRGRPANTKSFVFTPVPKPGALLPNPRWPAKVWSVNVDDGLPTSRALLPLVDLYMKQKEMESASRALQ